MVPNRPSKCVRSQKIRTTTYGKKHLIIWTARLRYRLQVAGRTVQWKIAITKDRYERLKGRFKPPRTDIDQTKDLTQERSTPRDCEKSTAPLHWRDPTAWEALPLHFESTSANEDKIHTSINRTSSFRTDHRESS